MAKPGRIVHVVGAQETARPFAPRNRFSLVTPREVTKKAIRSGLLAARRRPPMRFNAFFPGDAEKPLSLFARGSLDRAGAPCASAGRFRSWVSAFHISPYDIMSNSGMVFNRSRFKRVMQRCTPSMVQSCNPATPSAQPSHTPRVNTFQA